MDSRLKQILSANKETDFGKKYDFKHISSEEEYAKKVPLAKIDDFKVYVNLATRLGEKNIIAKDDIIAYCDTLSDDGQHFELVPCTKDHIKGLVDQFSSLLENNISLFLFESESGKRKYADKAVYNSFAGVALSEIVKINLRKASFKFLKKNVTSSPKQLLIENEFVDNIMLRLLFALLSKDLTQIIAISSFSVLQMFRILEDNWNVLVDSIRNGNISELIIPNEETRLEFNSLLKSDSRRADELQEIFKQGFETPVAVKVWPKLNRIVCNGYGSYKIYTENCKRYTRGVNFYNSVLGDSTAILGFGVPNTHNSFILNKTNSYLEFIPVDAKEDNTVTYSEIKPGQEYELVVTNNAGLYRVRSNIVLRIEKTIKDQIIVNYCYFIPETYSFANEKMFETNISDAIVFLIRTTNISIDDFAFEVDEKNRCYNIYLEPNLYAKDKINLDSLDKSLLSSLMDSGLQLANLKYAEARLQGKINPCCVHILESQTQLLCYDKMKIIAHKNGDSFKPVHFLITEEYKNLFLPFVKKD